MLCPPLSWIPPASSNQGAEILGLAPAFSDQMCAVAATRLYRSDNSLAGSNTNWLVATTVTSAIRDGQNLRLTAIIPWQNRLLIGAVTGLWSVNFASQAGGARSWSVGPRIGLPGDRLQPTPYSEPVLALAVHPALTHFYVSAPSGVYRLASTTANPERLPPLTAAQPVLPPPGAAITSLYIWSDNNGNTMVVAGMLAHGIWQYNDQQQQWQQTYAPPALASTQASMTLGSGQMALVGFNWPLRQNCLINAPSGISVVRVAQPGFPSQVFQPPAPAAGFPLVPGSVILAIRNDRSSQVTLQVTQDDQGNIMITEIGV